MGSTAAHLIPLTTNTGSLVWSHDWAAFLLDDDANGPKEDLQNCWAERAPHKTLETLETLDLYRFSPRHRRRNGGSWLAFHIPLHIPPREMIHGVAG